MTSRTDDARRLRAIRWIVDPACILLNTDYAMIFFSRRLAGCGEKFRAVRMAVRRYRAGMRATARRSFDAVRRMQTEAARSKGGLCPIDDIQCAKNR